MIDPAHLLKEVIKPTLSLLQMAGKSAEHLLLGTIAAESAMGTFLHQKDGGPALGIYQIEPSTHDDVWTNFLSYRKDLHSRMRMIKSCMSNEENLAGNLFYGTGVARLIYWRAKGEIPSYKDIEGLANYWKQHYNTPQGAGTVEHFIECYKRYVHEHFK